MNADELIDELLGGTAATPDAIASGTEESDKQPTHSVVQKHRERLAEMAGGGGVGVGQAKRHGIMVCGKPLTADQIEEVDDRDRTVVCTL